MSSNHEDDSLSESQRSSSSTTAVGEGIITAVNTPTGTATTGTSTKQARNNIVEPADADVLCGRGGAALRHSGNQTYRNLVNMNKSLYITCLKTEKLKISRSIVTAIREQKGRFLEKDAKTGLWYDIGDKKAIEKTSQALREGQPKLRQRIVEMNTTCQVAAAAAASMGMGMTPALFMEAHAVQQQQAAQMNAFRVAAAAAASVLGGGSGGGPPCGVVSPAAGFGIAPVNMCLNPQQQQQQQQQHPMGASMFGGGGGVNPLQQQQQAAAAAAAFAMSQQSPMAFAAAQAAAAAASQQMQMHKQQQYNALLAAAMQQQVAAQQQQQQQQQQGGQQQAPPITSMNNTGVMNTNGGVGMMNSMMQGKTAEMMMQQRLQGLQNQFHGMNGMMTAGNGAGGGTLGNVTSTPTAEQAPGSDGNNHHADKTTTTTATTAEYGGGGGTRTSNINTSSNHSHNNSNHNSRRKSPLVVGGQQSADLEPFQLSLEQQQHAPSSQTCFSSPVHSMPSHGVSAPSPFPQQQHQQDPSEDHDYVLEQQFQQQQSMHNHNQKHSPQQQQQQQQSPLHRATKPGSNELQQQSQHTTAQQQQSGMYDPQSQQTPSDHLEHTYPEQQPRQQYQSSLEEQQQQQHSQFRTKRRHRHHHHRAITEADHEQEFSSVMSEFSNLDVFAEDYNDSASIADPPVHTTGRETKDRKQSRSMPPSSSSASTADALEPNVLSWNAEPPLHSRDGHDRKLSRSMPPPSSNADALEPNSISWSAEPLDMQDRKQSGSMPPPSAADALEPNSISWSTSDAIAMPPPLAGSPSKQNQFVQAYAAASNMSWGHQPFGINSSQPMLGTVDNDLSFYSSSFYNSYGMNSSSTNQYQEQFIKSCIEAPPLSSPRGRNSCGTYDSAGMMSRGTTRSRSSSSGGSMGSFGAGSAAAGTTATPNNNNNNNSKKPGTPKENNMDRRRIFARMKYNRPPSVNALFKTSSRSISADGMPDIHMVESCNSVYSNLSNMSGLSPIGDGYGKQMVETARIIDHSRAAGLFNMFPDVMVAGSRRSIMSGLSRISDSSMENSLFSDLSKKIGNVSTRSIAMSEISVIDLQEQENEDETSSHDDPVGGEQKIAEFDDIDEEYEGIFDPLSVGTQEQLSVESGSIGEGRGGMGIAY